MHRQRTATCHISVNTAICLTWCIHMCSVIHSCVWDDVFICAMLIHMCSVIHSFVWTTCLCVPCSSIRVCWLICMYDMICLRVPCSFIRVAWFIRVWSDVLMFMARFIQKCVMTHVWRMRQQKNGENKQDTRKTRKQKICEQEKAECAKSRYIYTYI